MKHLVNLSFRLPGSRQLHYFTFYLSPPSLNCWMWSTELADELLFWGNIAVFVRYMENVRPELDDGEHIILSHLDWNIA